MFIFIYVFLNVTIFKNYSKYNGDETIFVGKIIKFQIKDDYLSLEIKAKENLRCNYYFKNSKQKQDFINTFQYGDFIKIKGKLSLPKNNTNPNQFNYKKYLYYQRQFYILKIENYEKYKDNEEFIYKIKNYINNRINKIDSMKVKNYLNAFILGNNKDIDSVVRDNYQIIGVSHLLAISGMHVSIFTTLILFILNKLNINQIFKYFFVFIFLFLYCFITNYSPSILRASLMFFFLSINKIFNINLSNMRIYIIVISSILIINPFYIFDIGFLFSAIISFYLILFNKLISSKKGYFTKLFCVSFISWIVSMPIVIYISYEINLLSVFYNLILVPFVTIILFPISILTLLIPCIYKLFLLFIKIFEFISNTFSLIPSIIILKKPSLFIILCYFVIITFLLFALKYNRKKYILILLMFLFVHYNYNMFFPSNYMVMLDVGQGDCFLFHSNNKTFLLDTGGLIQFKNNNLSSNSKEVINVIKSFGIRKIDYLFITHGDYDHMGNADKLVDNFIIKNVIFNCNKFNDLEKDLIEVLEKKNIKYLSCINELKIDKYKLRFLNTREYDNENDNSSVIYLNYNNYKFLFMGDAGIDKEKDILDKYNLSNIDFLKVGHHGSNMSSSEYFVDSINPKYSLISVGKNNKYGHPKESVLNILENSKVYRTDIDGSIEIKISKNKYKIRTYNP